MANPFYVPIWVGALCGLWFLWSFGLRPLALDTYRERMFELRFELFRLGMNGELPFDNEAYRMLEILLCGLIRFGHRISFSTYVFSSAEQTRARKAGELVDVSQQIDLKVSRLPVATQEKLKGIIANAHSAIVIYMAFSSLLFLLLMIIFGTAKMIGLWRPSKATISRPVEQEAYRTEMRHPLRVAIA